MSDAPDAADAVLVARDQVEILFLVTADEPVAMRAGWETLEAAVGLRGRKFFGVFDPRAHEYRVCVQRRDGDDPDAFGLRTGTLPGGRFARLRLEGEPPAVYERIGPLAGLLASRPDADHERPTIEFYRRRDVIDLLQPIR